MNDIDESGFNYKETDLRPTMCTTTTTEEPFGNSDWVCAYLNSDSNFYRLFLMRLTHSIKPKCDNQLTQVLYKHCKSNSFFINLTYKTDKDISIISPNLSTDSFK